MSLVKFAVLVYSGDAGKVYPCDAQGLCGFCSFVWGGGGGVWLMFSSGTGWVRNNQLVASHLAWSNEGKQVYETDSLFRNAIKHTWVTPEHRSPFSSQ